MSELTGLEGHKHHAAAVAILEPFRRCVQGEEITARVCDDGSIELRARGPDWRATVYLDDTPDDSGWILVHKASVGPPGLEAGTLGDISRLAEILADVATIAA